MSNEQRHRNTFVVPQKKADKRFNAMTAKRSINGISLETANGTQLVNVPIQVRINKVIPNAFRIPLQAWVAAISAVARVFGMKIIFELQDDE